MDYGQDDRMRRSRLFSSFLLGHACFGKGCHLVEDLRAGLRQKDSQGRSRPFAQTEVEVKEGF